MLSLLKLFRQQGWTVRFACAATPGEHRLPLQPLSIEEIPIQLNHPSFDQLIADNPPDLVMFDRFMTEEQFGWRVRQHAPNALCVLDTEDLHALRDARQRARVEGREMQDRDLFSEKACREIASILRCDLSLIISAVEMQYLQKIFSVPKTVLHELPFMLPTPTESERQNWPDYKARKDYISIGNFRHPPNWDSVQYLKQTIWPLIRQRQADATIHIYGAYPPKKATALHDSSHGFLVRGWAENAGEVMQQSRVCLAPLRFGAGLKGKLALAMQCGTPSVTTPIGAEGMQGKPAWNVKVESDPAAFADAAVALYQDQTCWQLAQDNGLAVLAQRFNPELLGEALIRKLSALLADREAHRAKNFLHKLLNHHQLQSSRYMGLWIEAKNKMSNQGSE